MRIAVTGSSGLIGTALSARLIGQGAEIVAFDLRSGQDVRDAGAVRAAVEGVDGIVHLAAVSRVAWGERDPAGCEATNVGGTRNVLEAASRGSRRPWVVLASSREVYGQPAAMPVREDQPLAPINAYGRSKAEGERLVFAARDLGLVTAVVRLSNVYGRTTDHPDRVVPAFCRAAALGGPLRVEGSGQAFDFTFLDDVVGGLVALIESVDRQLPPIHLVSGRPTTLGELAALAVGDRGNERIEAASRTYDVHRFWGDPSRARELLGWRATTALEDGIGWLVRAFEAESSPQGRPW